MYNAHVFNKSSLLRSSTTPFRPSTNILIEAQFFDYGAFRKNALINAKIEIKNFNYIFDDF